MSYNFELIGITPVLTFFNYQQQLETIPQKSKIYLGSYQCTLDSFIESIDTIPQKPQWNWDKAIETIINFWLKHEANIRHWQRELKQTEGDKLIVARVANLECLRAELEQTFDV